MTRSELASPDTGGIPTNNPCAQCGTPIPAPDWIEPDHGRTFYLWHCRACGYRFEAVAIFDAAADRRPPLAA